MFFYNVVFNSTNVTIKVPVSVIKLFKTLDNMLSVLEDTNLSTSDTNIPILNIPIPDIYILTEYEADMFFQYAYQIHNLSDHDALEFIKSSYILNSTLLTYINLANYLEYENYFNTLCKYLSYLIRNN